LLIETSFQWYIIPMVRHSNGTSFQWYVTQSTKQSSIVNRKSSIVNSQGGAFRASNSTNPNPHRPA
jgi:hypothetical protein